MPSVESTPTKKGLPPRKRQGLGRATAVHGGRAPPPPTARRPDSPWSRPAGSTSPPRARPSPTCPQTVTPTASRSRRPPPRAGWRPTRPEAARKKERGEGGHRSSRDVIIGMRLTSGSLRRREGARGIKGAICQFRVGERWGARRSSAERRRNLHAVPRARAGATWRVPRREEVNPTGFVPLRSQLCGALP